MEESSELIVYTAHIPARLALCEASPWLSTRMDAYPHIRKRMHACIYTLCSELNPRLAALT
jgi:hypothetical protein